MKLVNFSLFREPRAVELQALGVLWDLHNIADYLGMRQDIPSNTFQMTWRIAPHPQYGRRTYPAEQFSVLFTEVDYLAITTRDKELPHSEDDCVATVSRIGYTDPLVPFPEAIQGDDFHLLFEFQSGQTIRIGAKAAQFICDEKKSIQQGAGPNDEERD